MNMPKVYGVGDVTLCINQEKLRLYVEHLEVGYIRKIEFSCSDNGVPNLSVTFAVSNDKDIALAIDESMRLVKAHQWIKVNQ